MGALIDCKCAFEVQACLHISDGRWRCTACKTRLAARTSPYSGLRHKVVSAVSDKQHTDACAKQDWQRICGESEERQVPRDIYRHRSGLRRRIHCQNRRMRPQFSSVCRLNMTSGPWPAVVGTTLSMLDLRMFARLLMGYRHSWSILFMLSPLCIDCLPCFLILIRSMMACRVPCAQHDPQYCGWCCIPANASRIGID